MVGSDLEPELSNAVVTRLATLMAIALRDVHPPGRTAVQLDFRTDLDRGKNWLTPVSARGSCS
jgi:hypothetical protein